MYGYLAQKMSLRDIGKKLGRNHTTLSRELDRHERYWRPYIPCEADRRAKRIGLKQRRRSALKKSFDFLVCQRKVKTWLES